MRHMHSTPGFGPGPAEAGSRGHPEAYLLAGAAAEAYLATELVTAPPRRLQAILYDAAIRACRQAVEALDCGDVPTAADRLRRARTIVLHLQSAVAGPGSPQPAGELAELYREVLGRLLEADQYRKRETVAESIRLLHARRGALTTYLEAPDAPGESARPHAQCGSWLG